MKIRKGFVTNSSSTSYICDICGRIVDDVPDAYSSLRYRFVTCENGHEFCTDHLLNIPKQILTNTADLDEWMGENDISEYEVPEEYCPICKYGQYNAELLYNDSYKLEYVLKKYNLTKEDLNLEIRNYLNMQE